MPRPDHESNCCDSSLLLADVLRRLGELERRVAEKDAKICELERQLKEARKEGRKGKRQATPFSKGKKKANPKKPGRKKGQGLFSRRMAPEPTGPPVPVTVEQERCACGGELVRAGVETVTVTEVPEQPAPEVTQYDIEVCRCGRCGKWQASPRQA